MTKWFTPPTQDVFALLQFDVTPEDEDLNALMHMTLRFLDVRKKSSAEEMKVLRGQVKELVDRITVRLGKPRPSTPEEVKARWVRAFCGSATNTVLSLWIACGGHEPVPEETEKALERLLFKLFIKQDFQK